jgi:hypothetical protein
MLVTAEVRCVNLYPSMEIEIELPKKSDDGELMFCRRLALVA